MSYAVRVTRRCDVHRHASSEIDLEEWRALVAGDPTLSIENAWEATNPKGEVIRVERDGITRWTGHSKGVVWLDFSPLGISVGNPDDELIGKLHEIAGKLAACVRGEEGEHYDAAGQIAKISTQTRRWWHWKQP